MKFIDQVYTHYGQFEDKFTQALNQNKRMIADGYTWMEKAKSALDEYSHKTMENPSYIAYDMLDCRQNEDILTMGESVLDRNEKQKEFPSLIGLDTLYN